MMSSPISEISSATSNKTFASLCNLHRDEKLEPSICKIEIDGGKNKILCSHCGKEFSGISTLNRHIRNIHEIEHYSRPLATENADDKVLCSHCGKAFSNTSSLNKHIRNIHNIRRYSRQPTNERAANEILCSHCSKTFGRISTLNVHIRNIHKIKHYSRPLTTEEAANKVPCSHCGKAFSNASSLNKHIRNIHKIKRYSRPLTTEEAANKVLCSHCGKAFSNASSLNKHIRNIHKIKHYSRPLTTEEAANKVPCSHCGKAFSNASSLNKHIRNIHKIKRYSQPLTTEEAANKALCSHCGKAFSNASSLNKHIRNVHKIKYYSRQRTIEIAANDQISQRHINCNLCDKTFNTSYKLRYHKVKFHGVKPSKRNVQKKLQESPKNMNINEIISNLPVNFNYTVHPVHPRTKSEFIKVDFPVTHIGDLQTWLQQYCELNKIFLKKYSLLKPKNNSIVFKECYGCGHRVRILRRSRMRASSLEKHTNCSFRIMLNIFKQTDDKLLARVRISSNHNHVVGGVASVKFRHVSDEVREKLLYLFSRQYTPVIALRAHSDDLKEEYGDEYYRIQGDRYYMPDLQWVYYLHRKVYKDDFGLQYRAKMLETFKEKVANNDNVRLKIIDDNSNFLLSIVTPFMLRVHEEILQSEEMVFMDSTGTLDMLGCKIFVIFTNSFSGGLPLGVIVTTTETIEAISDGLKMVQELISEKSFGGRGKKGPILFMINDSQAERNALHNVFPEAMLLLCQFYILQAMWHYVWNNSAGMRTADRITIFSMFKSLVYERNEILFKKKASDMLQNRIVLQYPILQKHLQDVLITKKDWASCFRNSPITRGQNTDNLCEASMWIIKEVILNQCRVYSLIELLKIITTEFQDYYINKLRSIASRHMPDYLCSKFDKLSNKISDTIVFDKAASKVTSKNKEYFIDFEMGLCSCTEGTGGKLCKHLLVALKDSGVESHLTFPKTEDELKSIFYIAEGRHLDDNDNWFKPLCVQPTNYQNIEVTNQIIEPICTFEAIVEEMIQCEFDDNLNISSDVEDQYIDGESEMDSTIKSLRDIATLLEYNTMQDPMFHIATRKFVDTFKKMSYSAIISALHYFGKAFAAEKSTYDARTQSLGETSVLEI